MISVFDQHAGEYDKWYDDHADIYKAELEAVKQLLPENGMGLEVGAGSGRFAGPLHISHGVEPSPIMAGMAADRGVTMVSAIAESLPFADRSFDYIVFITSLCFVSSLTRALSEAHRVLQRGGRIVIGLVNPDSELGRQYELRKQDSRFYRDARFVSVSEISEALAVTGYERLVWRQTLLCPTDDERAYKVMPGYDQGGFLVLAAKTV